MIAKNVITPETKQCKIGGCSTLFKNKKNCIVRGIVITQNQLAFYQWNSEEINQVLKQEIGETFPTYYDEVKNLDDTWKPISLQGENSKTLLFLPFLPKWEIQNDKRVFTGIWDVRNKQEYDLKEKFVQEIWPQIQLLDQRIIGTILAHGSADKKTPRITFSLKKAQNVYWKYIFLKPFSNKAPLLSKYYNKRTCKTYFAYKFYTISLFKDYRELFYPNGKKIVPQFASDLLQSPEGLAEFYMDVGTFVKTNGASVINTNSYSRAEQEFLQKQLFKFHGLKTLISKRENQLVLYLPKANNPILISKLYDHILPMFYYKLGLENQLQSHEMEEEFNRQDLREFQRNLNTGVLL